ncbi:acyl-CoA synthetase [Microbacterium sp. cx-55]|uniref:acyl-CoA synthetase n=1 Tax=unclassified Microbacterium TaxID=2609290 RepID=UPI001CBE2DE8|nr:MULTISPECIES: acyl-CoA synthetase [unclassified Microbacterium]MBZ4488489.1 acyl-CoA synthetase [Microbacterium sp. cx-55]MCC4909442.1 acyl-CoA synthetase [Microbacterium sp. cx-59]UGB35130.1 acyl-CoA synthetase [Microbacterium sp. cx-55]
MPDRTPERAFQPRHVQLARALFAVVAAVMITFSPDHSASVGLSVFSGFAIATALVLLISAWLVFPAGQRALVLTLGVLTALAGMASGIPAFRTTEVFFGVVVSWALLTGLVEGIAGFRARRGSARGSALRSQANDELTVGVVGVLLGLGLLLVPTQYALDYYIDEAAQSFTLTGITIGVGLFGAYAAIVGVYLAIAAFSPRRETSVTEVAS